MTGNSVQVVQLLLICLLPVVLSQTSLTPSNEELGITDFPDDSSLLEPSEVIDLHRCYTCTDVADNDVCNGDNLGGNGTLHVCANDDPMCYHEFVVNPTADGWIHRKGCMTDDECYDKMFESMLDSANTGCFDLVLPGRNLTANIWCFNCCFLIPTDLIDRCNTGNVTDGFSYLPDVNNWNPSMQWDLIKAPAEVVDLNRCYTCQDVIDNDECNGDSQGGNGTLQICDYEYPQCFTEIRVNPIGDGWLTRKGCMDADSCYDSMFDSLLLDENVSCFGGSEPEDVLQPYTWCFTCCIIFGDKLMDKCNVRKGTPMAVYPDVNNWDPLMQWDFTYIEVIEASSIVNTKSAFILVTSVLFTNVLVLL